MLKIAGEGSGKGKEYRVIWAECGVLARAASTFCSIFTPDCRGEVQPAAVLLMFWPPLPPAQPSPATGQENDDCRLTGHFTRRPQPPTPPPPHHHYTAFVTQVSRWYFSRNSLALYEQKCSRTLLQPLHSRYSTFWVCWPTHATLTVHIEMSLPTFGCLLWMFINGLSVNESILWGVGAYFRNRYLMRGAQCSAQQERFPRSLCSSPPTNVQPFDSPPRLRAADRSVYPDKDKNQWRAETDGVLFLLCVFLLSS